MSKKSKRKQSSDDEFPMPGIHPDVLREQLQGFWEAMLPPDFPEDDGFLDFEEHNIVVTQDDEDGSRFIAFYETDTLYGSFDIRVLPLMAPDDDTPTLLFTFHEEDEFEELHGGGFLSVIEPGVLAGVKLYHMGETTPIFWKRTSKDLPEEYTQLQNADPENMSMNDVFTTVFQREAPDSIQDFFFTDAVKKVLLSENITTISQLLQMSDAELLAIKGIGQKKLEDIKQLLSRFGLLETPSYEANDELANHVFKFKVALDIGRVVWREFELLGQHTLHDLHVMIQIGFDWDDDHLYSFYMNGVYWDDDSAVSHPFVGDEFDATEVTLNSLSLKPGKNFCYIFDFGDTWKHKIEVLSVSDTPVEEKLLDDYPKQTNSKGKAPEQYPEDDD